MFMKIQSNWFKKMDKHYSDKYRCDVIKDLKENKLDEKVLDFRDTFIKFACIERMNFMPDINDELECYLKRQRLYTTNVKEWYKLRNTVFERDEYTCKYCGKKGGKLEADHIIPFSKGGSNDLENLNTSCRKCNREKRDKNLSEFLDWRKNKKI